MNFLTLLASDPVIPFLGRTYDISLNWLGQLIRILIEGIGIVGVGIIVFSIILRMIVLPFDIYQRVTMRKQNIKMKENKEKMEKLAEREATINKLQAEVDAQNARLQSLLNSVKDALLGFSSDELTVTEKNGKIYVAMSDKLLFESGSAQVNKQGKEALGKLAEVLKKQHDIDVFIEGHTDNKPIKTVQFKDNWDLSVVRATSVVRILTKDYGVNPLQILPCGRGEFMPVDNNESVEGRAHNRRTEIIMAPKLDKLMDILK